MKAKSKTWAIATIMYEGAKPWYVKSLFATLTVPEPPEDFAEPAYIAIDHMYAAHAREQAGRAALELDLSGVLWIDSDMEWSPYRVLEMLALVRLHPKAVIAFPYPARKLEMWVGQSQVDALPNNHGLIAAHTIGFGFTWTPIKCFQRPEPWFSEQWEDGNGFSGEDIWFTRHLPASIPVLLAPGKPVGHGFEPGPRRKLQREPF